MTNRSKLIIILGTIALGIIGVTALSIVNKPKIKELEQITPGSTNASDLKSLPNQLGQREENGKTRLIIGQNQPQSYSTVEIENNTVKNVIINDRSKFEFPTATDFIGKYGTPDLVLFGPWQESGYQSLVFLKTGLIVIAHQKVKDVVEVWKIPQNLTPSDFTSIYGTTFTSSPAPQNQF